MNGGLKLFLLGAGGQIVTPARLTNPRTIPGLQVWYDAQQPVYTAGYGSVVTTLGGQVTILPDQSGNGRDATAVSTKPTYDPTGINGHPCLNFNGNSYMKPAAFLDTSYNTAFTMVVVAAAGSLAANKVICGSSAAYIARNGATSLISSAAANLSTQPTSNTIINTSGIAAWVYDGANITYMDDCVLGTAGLGGSNASSKTASTGNLGLNGLDFAVGGLPSGGFLWPDKVAEVLLWNVALTDDQFRQVCAYESAKWGYNVKPLVVFTGDSLISGTGSSGGPNQLLSTSGTNLPSRVYNQISATADVRTDAFPGRTIAQMVTQSPGFSDLYNFPEARRYINVMAIGTNTLGATQSLSATYAQYVSACLAKRALGQRVIASTITPRQDGVYGAFEADRLAFNAMVLANYLTFAHDVQDVGSIAVLQNPLDTTYFDADKVHLKNAGYAAQEPVSTAAVQRQLAA